MDRGSFLDSRMAISAHKIPPCHAASFAPGDLPYHMLNRRVERLPLFEKPADYADFEKILAEAQAQTKIHITAYCLISNH